MTVKKKEIATKQEQKETFELSINDLKAQAYDVIAQVEQHQRAAQQLQQQLQQINEQILRKTQEEARKRK